MSIHRSSTRSAAQSKSARPVSARAAVPAAVRPVTAVSAAAASNSDRAAANDARSSLCRFTFADGRQCRTPRAGHPHFCAFHARKLARSQSADDLAREISFYFSSEYLSANDLSAALARLIPAVLRGDLNSKAAKTLAYLAQTLTQLLRISEHEYINAFGADTWRRAIRNSVRGNFAHRAGSGIGGAGTLACAASAAPPSPPPATPVSAAQAQDSNVAPRLQPGISSACSAATPGRAAPTPAPTAAAPATIVPAQGSNVVAGFQPGILPAPSIDTAARAATTAGTPACTDSTPSPNAPPADAAAIASSPTINAPADPFAPATSPAKAAPTEASQPPVAASDSSIAPLAAASSHPVLRSASWDSLAQPQLRRPLTPLE